MTPSPLHPFHERLQARFATERDCEVVADYGDPTAELAAMRASAVLVDLSARSRICLLGKDRHRFLHGQVSNQVKELSPGQGCYACLLNAKGKMESDLNIFCLPEELLLDFEPGWTAHVLERLEKYVIADDVQLVDVACHYGLLGLWGCKTPDALRETRIMPDLPDQPWRFTKHTHARWGDIYCMNQPRLTTAGYHLFVPLAFLEETAQCLLDAVNQTGGRMAGWRALEMHRIESGIPRFGIDMDSTNLPPEAGLESRAISYDKGCYIGQEVISRIRTYGQVAKALRGIRLSDSLSVLPQKGDPLLAENKEVGYITSAVHSPTLNANLALGYVRKEHNQLGTALRMRTAEGVQDVKVVPVPFT